MSLPKIAKNNIYIKIFLIGFLCILFANIPKEYLGETYPICLYRIVLGTACIGCGTTRAVWSLLHFDFKAAYEYNKLIIIIFPVMAGCIISWILSSRKIPRHPPPNRSGITSVLSNTYKDMFRNFNHEGT